MSRSPHPDEELTDRRVVAFARPAAGLAALVERYWWSEGGAGALPRLLPGTGAELWVHWSGGVDLRPVGGGPPERRSPAALPAAHLVCLRRTPWSVEHRAGAGRPGFVAVRFRAGALRHLVPVGLDELADRTVGAEELWGAPGRRLVERVRSARGPAERVAVLDRFLTGRLEAHHRPDPWLDAAVGRIYRRPAGLRMDRLAETIGVGPRQLQRMFPAAVGAGPKEFQRLARFQRVARLLLRSERPHRLAAALDAGYYDQSHFTRESRRLTGERPAELLAPGRSHFYYPSLTADGQAGLRPTQEETR
ncbi:helix-turn-helix domain-containing protein [Kitasatospora sp. NPDC094019]|uniref:helix-turn-helix transcriptional regulator n=1 Tax=Kitasatospora sp. NPDC094019 TaxID=3364091 RepID=UPI003822E748